MSALPFPTNTNNNTNNIHHDLPKSSTPPSKIDLNTGNNNMSAPSTPPSGVSAQSPQTPGSPPLRWEVRMATTPRGMSHIYVDRETGEKCSPAEMLARNRAKHAQVIDMPRSPSSNPSRGGGQGTKVDIPEALNLGEGLATKQSQEKNQE